ncbi:MAG: hypothetical protein WAL97_05785 [Halobacteriota archaeon]|jgi:hypothetical protein
MFTLLAAIREELDPFANVSIQTTEGSVYTRMKMSGSLVRRTEIITIIWQNEKRQLVNSTALTSKKMKLAILMHYFLLKRPQFQKMIERAAEGNDWHAIVAARCR